MPTPVRILILDAPDTAGSRLLELLRRGFAPPSLRVETAEELSAALGEGPWEVVLWNGTLSACREAGRQNGESGLKTPSPPTSSFRQPPSGPPALALQPSEGRYRFLFETTPVMGPSHDIRERRRAEPERDRLPAQQRLPIERMPLGCLVTDAQFRIIDWNHAAGRIFGYGKEETLGMGPPFEKILPPDAWPQVEDLLRRIRSGEMVAQAVNENLTRDGRRITCEWYHTPLLDGDGTFVGLLSLAQDITARREAELAWQLRDRAIQAATQGILITDPGQPDNPIVYASPGFQRLTGYTPAEVIGRNGRFLQGKDTDPGMVAQVREAVRQRQPCTVELLNYRKDGSPFWNELSIAPVVSPDGRLTHFVGVMTDVSRRRRLEEQYRQSQRMEAIGQLAGGIAHDFNNLLTIINGYSDVLLQGLAPDDPRREPVEEIKKAGERSAALTRQLLVFSRKQVVSPQVVDLNTLVGDTERMLRRLIGEDVRLQTSLRAKQARVKADPGQLEQVLLNLAVNARDAMPKGGTLSIETADVELPDAVAGEVVPSGPYVLLAASDTGCGMSREVKARIFEPFFTTKTPGKGTGLGLAVVESIVKQAGGFILVESEPGAGTTFKVYLPRVAQQVRSSKSLLGLRSAPQGTETVLLVEDEDAVRALTRQVLAGCGYTVLEAGNGLEGQRVAEQHQGTIHLLVTDVVMPELGGRELAERVVALHPEAKVLYLSGYTDDAVVRHGVLHEEVPFLPKPFSPLALTVKVREVLDSP